MGSCLRKSDASAREVDSWAQKTDRALQLNSATGSSAEVRTEAQTLKPVVPSSKAADDGIHNIAADHKAMMLEVMEMGHNVGKPPSRAEEVPDNTTEKASVSSTSTTSWGLDNEESAPRRTRASDEEHTDGEPRDTATQRGDSPTEGTKPLDPHMPQARDNAQGVGGDINASLIDATAPIASDDALRRDDRGEQQKDNGTIRNVKNSRAPTDLSQLPATTGARHAGLVDEKTTDTSGLKRRSSLADMGQMAVTAMKSFQRRSSLQEVGAVLSSLTVPGFSHPKGGENPSKPCEKKFNVFFFKHPTTSMAERGYMPSPNPTQSVALVNYKRLLYESHTVWYTLLYFRGMYWVGMRPKPTLQETTRKQAAAEKSFSWETVARRFIFSRASKILEKNPTAPVECICNTVTSELWGARGIASTHPLVTNASLVVSLDGDPAYFKPDDIPWVKDIPHMMDVSRPAANQPATTTSRPKDSRSLGSRRAST